jgi:hypothetical protein
MRNRISKLLMAATAGLVLGMAPSAVAQVAVSGTFYGPHGAVRFRSGAPYGGYGYAGDRYAYEGDRSCDRGYAYAPTYGYYGYAPYPRYSYGYRPYVRRHVYYPRHHDRHDGYRYDGYRSYR